MTFYKSNGDRVPDHIVKMAESTKAGGVDRREFLAMASIFGASTAMAYSMIGLAAPTPAVAQETPKKGGVLKVSMSVKDPKDPRTADWSEIANAERQALEPLVKYTRDFTFEGYLLDSWEINEDATEYVDESRVDQRYNKGNWCNQDGAGLGERPTASPEAGIDAYVWIKPPGESDGASEEIDNDQGKGFDEMCDPAYQGNIRNNNNPSGARDDMPLSGHWSSEQFQELLENAYPPL
jgi:hypothetical protein